MGRWEEREATTSHLMALEDWVAPLGTGHTSRSYNTYPNFVYS